MFTALGFPAGSDTEIANAIVWLASMGIVPLSQLAENLPFLRYSTDTDKSFRWLSSAEFEITVNPSIEHLLLTEVADILGACAARQNRPSRATTRNMRNAALLLPITLQRSLGNVRFEIVLSEFRTIVENGQLWSNYDLENACDIQLMKIGVVTCSGSGELSGKSDVESSGLDLKFRTEEKSEFGSNRIEVDEGSFLTLKQKAVESFVPNSELSRRSGAGAEVDDSS